MNDLTERERTAEILRIGEAHGVVYLAHDAIARGDSPATFRHRLLDQAEPKRHPVMLGMSRPELARYSLAAALSAIATGSISKLGFEREISDELVARHGTTDNENSLLLPPDILHRDLTAAAAGAGGFLVQTENVGWVEAARPRSAVMALGAQVLEGLVGGVTIPRVLTGAAQNWLATEAGQAGESTFTLGQLSLTPKTVTSFVEFSRQLLLQATPAVERVIAQDLLAGIAAAVDLRAFQGSGANGQPLGIIATPGIGSQSGTDLNVAGTLAMQATCGVDQAQFSSGGYVTTSTIAQSLAARIATGSSDFVWTGNLRDGMVSGFPAKTSLHAGTANVIFGDFGQLVVGSWGVLQVDYDPFTKFQSAIIGARIMHSVDVGLRYPAAFSVASSVT
jgi:HK97 family phage major capsid protein